MAQGPYSTHSWRPVPVSARRARFGDALGSSTDGEEDDDGAQASDGGRGGWLRAVLLAAGRLLWVSCAGLGLLAAVVLAAVALGYAVDNHALLKKLGGAGASAGATHVVDATGCAVAPFPPTADFTTPPPRVALNPAPRKWRPFYSQWTCGQSHAAFLPNLLANGLNSFVDEQNYTDYFLQYTDIVREYLPGAGRLSSCSRKATQQSVGYGGAVACEPLTTWGRPCVPPETAASTADAASTRPAGSVTLASSTVPTPCQTGWHSPSRQEQMASDGHAYCARFCDGFASTKFFNVRKDGKSIACYCLAQCLGNDNPTVSAINSVAGSNEWDVWALDEEGFTPELLAAPAL